MRSYYRGSRARGRRKVITQSLLSMLWKKIWSGSRVNASTNGADAVLALPDPLLTGAVGIDPPELVIGALEVDAGLQADRV